MSITNGIKFFNKSKISDATATATVSGDASVSALLDSNKETFYRSVASDDTTTEIIEITFSEEKTIDRIFLKDFNAKEFRIQYWNSAGFFLPIGTSATLTSSTAAASIYESDYALDTFYAELSAPLTTTALKIQLIKTQTPNEEKYVNQVIATSELSTLVGYPEVKAITANRNLRTRKTISGRFSIQKSLETFAINLAFKDYPSSSVYNVDIDAVLELHDSEEPFLVWLCGGSYGDVKFHYTLRGFRLKDIFQMQISKALKLSYTNNIYVNPVNVASIDLQEHI